MFCFNRTDFFRPAGAMLLFLIPLIVGSLILYESFSVESTSSQGLSTLGFITVTACLFFGITFLFAGFSLLDKTTSSIKKDLQISKKLANTNTSTMVYLLILLICVALVNKFVLNPLLSIPLPVLPYLYLLKEITFLSLYHLTLVHLYYNVQRIEQPKKAMDQ